MPLCSASTVQSRVKATKSTNKNAKASRLAYSSTEMPDLGMLPCTIKTCGHVRAIKQAQPSSSLAELHISAALQATRSELSSAAGNGSVPSSSASCSKRCSGSPAKSSRSRTARTSTRGRASSPIISTPRYAFRTPRRGLENMPCRNVVSCKALPEEKAMILCCSWGPLREVCQCIQTAASSSQQLRIQRFTSEIGPSTSHMNLA